MISVGLNSTIGTSIPCRSKLLAIVSWFKMSLRSLDLSFVEKSFFISSSSSICFFSWISTRSGFSDLFYAIFIQTKGRIPPLETFILFSMALSLFFENLFFNFCHKNLISFHMFTKIKSRASKNIETNIMITAAICILLPTCRFIVLTPAC